jgi:hypothetical protein
MSEIEQIFKNALRKSTAMRTSSGGGEQPSLSIYFHDLDSLNLFQDAVRKLCDEIIAEGQS